MMLLRATLSLIMLVVGTQADTCTLAINCGCRLSTFAAEIRHIL